jgi:hypothetical protein
VKVSVRGSGVFLSSSKNRQYQPALLPACGLVGMSLDEQGLALIELAILRLLRANPNKAKPVSIPEYVSKSGHVHWQ